MAQLANVLYCTAGTGNWFSYDGAAWSAALGAGATDPPNGASIVCAHTARLFAAGTIAGVYDQVYASNLGAAGAGQWVAATFSFRVGRGEGEAITAMVSAKGWWLCVGKEGSIFMVYADPAAASAATWQIVRVAGSIGCVGKRCLLAFGDYILVLARDGVRKISSNQNQDAPWDVSPPLSEPLQPYVDRINWAFAGKSVLHKYRHFAFVAVPLDSATEPSHVLVWNGRTERWMGVWTGWTPTALATSRFAGVERMLVGDSAGKVNQWKDYASTTLDATYLDNAVDIAGVMRSRSFDFGNQRNAKDGESMQLQFLDSTASATILLVCDGVERARWTESLEETSNQLPVDLPFDLAENRPKRVTKNLDALGEFREAYVEVQHSSKRAQLKSVAISAFVNTTDNE
jgi:hypothetical protein